MKEVKKKNKKDLYNREGLAIERVDLAIDRTFLAFLRTSLYFSIAGISVHDLLKVSYSEVIEILFWLISITILIIGIVKMIQRKRKLKEIDHLLDNSIQKWDYDID